MDLAERVAQFDLLHEARRILVNSANTSSCESPFKFPKVAQLPTEYTTFNALSRIFYFHGEFIACLLFSKNNCPIVKI
jgi:hypothetical protein